MPSNRCANLRLLAARLTVVVAVDVDSGVEVLGSVGSTGVVLGEGEIVVTIVEELCVSDSKST